MTIGEFWERVDKTEGCWVWVGRHDRNGYGRMRYNGRDFLAHRLSWEFEFGAPGDLCVLHACDNPPCVNPAHLFLGTQADNALDMWAKGRGRPGVLSGEQANGAKLTAADVLEIRASYNPKGPVSKRQLAERYGVSHSLIKQILSGKIWRGVQAVVTA